MLACLQRCLCTSTFTRLLSIQNRPISEHMPLPTSEWCMYPSLCLPHPLLPLSFSQELPSMLWSQCAPSGLHQACTSIHWSPSCHTALHRAGLRPAWYPGEWAGPVGNERLPSHRQVVGVEVDSRRRAGIQLDAEGTEKAGGNFVERSIGNQDVWGSRWGFSLQGSYGDCSFGGIFEHLCRLFSHCCRLPSSGLGPGSMSRSPRQSPFLAKTWLFLSRTGYGAGGTHVLDLTCFWIFSPLRLAWNC